MLPSHSISGGTSASSLNCAGVNFSLLIGTRSVTALPELFERDNVFYRVRAIKRGGFTRDPDVANCRPNATPPQAALRLFSCLPRLRKSSTEQRGTSESEADTRQCEAPIEFAGLHAIERLAE